MTDEATREAIETWETLIGHASEFLDPEAHVPSFWKKQTRPDGRLFAQASPLTLQTSLLPKVPGSALIEGSVLAVVSVQVGQGHTGDVLVSFQSEQPEHMWLQSKLQDTLQATIDFPSLVIPDTNQAWRIVVTLHLLEPLVTLDTILVACVAALRTTQIPAHVVIEEEIKENRRSKIIKTVFLQDAAIPADMKGVEFKAHPLQLNSCLPLATTMAFWEHDEKRHCLVDISTKEAQFLVQSPSTALITVVVNAHDKDNHKVLSLESTGSMSTQELALSMKFASARAMEIRTLLKA